MEKFESTADAVRRSFGDLSVQRAVLLWDTRLTGIDPQANTQSTLGMERSENNNKVFINVIAEFCMYGVVRPKAITWEDGKVYEIDRIIDIRNAASLKVGGIGLRYLCRICGQERY